ncbi:efflux transporter, RND family, MFP subunit [Clostridium sp. DL-VIII]|uniref:efflux RND transporter periplasmic adaptor subunit n=1 Tax=Clostridium sp. DL-VIII TaxID=641107 RepID=UPI00023AF4CD|nr:efflux RND transporter periplasmic adaptor subunit [Clostridium sp. DL-VIII]EHI97249.1 efflux transporter, RND family, MFP subunit [Clostridium sp. DL-VIII]
MPKLDIKNLRPKGISLKGLKLKKKPSKKIVVLSTIFVIAVAIVIWKFVIPKPAVAIKCTALSKGEVINSVSVLGEIKSQDSTNIYSTMNNSIKDVKVKEGDKVKAGDVLAILDSADLEKDIEQSIAAADAEEASDKTQTDTTQKTYEEELYLHDNNLNSDVKDAEEALNVAKINLDDKKKTYEKNETLFNSGAITESDFDKAKIDFDTANSEYEKAKVALESTKTKADEELNTAKGNYETAQAKGSDRSKRIGIEKQQQQLEACTIKATTDGTVTRVNAVVGNSGNGILFEIEDLDNIEITAPIKEVDIANVKAGQRVEIKTDATGEEVIPGEVISVSPVAQKGSIPQTQNKSDSQSDQTSSDGDFEAKVKINDANENIKVGMSARVNIITSEKSDIYAVSSESIVEKNGNKSIYIAEKSGKKPNEYIVREVPINIGLESDFNVEISGDGIMDGVMVINDPTVCKVGEKVRIDQR